MPFTDSQALTSKRKFQQLLDKLSNGNSSRISLSSTRNGTEGGSAEEQVKFVNGRPVKRPRTIASINSSTASLPTNDGGHTLATNRAAGAATSSNTQTPRSSTDGPRPPPNYSPWSQPQFLARLKTFADVKLWTPKPDDINEVQWAKRGWICEGINTVACKGGCEQRVVVTLRPKRKDAEGREIEGSEDYSVDVDDALVEKYVEIIVRGHDEHCLWRIAGCKEDIFRISLANSRKALQELEDRYKTFLPMNEALPERERLVIDSGWDALVTHLLRGQPAKQTSVTKADTHRASTEGEEDQDVPIMSTSGKEQALACPDGNQVEQAAEYAFAFESGKEPVPVIIRGFLFAIHGWKGFVDEAKNPTAHCESCFRRIGLWLYTKRDAISEDDNAPLHLNLLEEHREYCPWKNPTTEYAQGTYAGLAAWEILHRVISNSRPRQSAEQRRTSMASSGVTMQDAGVEGPAERQSDEKTLKERWKKLKGALSVKKKVKK